MPRGRVDLLQDLADGVLLMNEEQVLQAAHEVIDTGEDAYEAINNGLVIGMNQAGVLYETNEYFVPELLLCSDAMYAGIEILRPHVQHTDVQQKHKVVIGVVAGDTHDIGKNLVKIMLDAAGFDVHDLGRNVPLLRFVEEAKAVEASLICLSTLMTSTMDDMGEFIELLQRQGVRDNFQVMIGGGPISQGFAERIGADGYADNAAGAVKVAKHLVAKVPAMARAL